MSFDVMLRQMTAGFGQTCLIFFMTLIFSLPLGMLVYFGRVSRIKPISWIVKIYISIMRGTPLMLQLLVWYFAPYYLWQMNIGGYKLTAILLGCSLNYAAYFAEIYRSGIFGVIAGLLIAAVCFFAALVIASLAVVLAGFVVAVTGIGVGIAIHSVPAVLLMAGIGLILIALGVLATLFTGKLCIVMYPAMFRFIVELCRKPFHRKAVSE